MENVNKWTIDQIEAITEDEAWDMAVDTTEIKGHNVYFVDFGVPFGYSCLVYRDGHHIHYANDYQLHHRYTKYNDDDTTETVEPGEAELHQRYVDGLKNKLFTEAELLGPIKDYDEYSRKRYFLQNYYGMRQDYVSIFRVYPASQAAKVEAEFKEQTKGMTYDPVAFAYYKDADFVKHHIELLDGLEQAKEVMSDSYDYWKDAFKREMFNHEYGINWQADYDVLSCFGGIKWAGDCAPVSGYFDQLKFSNTKRKAYMDARREYFKECGDL